MARKPACSAAPGIGQGILLAALALPGIHAAQAETAPERASVAYRYLDYQDMQPGWDRVGVQASAVSVLLPIAGEWSLGGSWTRDAVSGASPAFHSEFLRHGDMEETRYGRDAQLTRYFQRGTVALGWVDSQESDYTSRGFSLAGTLSTGSKNTTLSAGVASNHDRVDVAAIGVTQESKDTDSWMLGVTQVLTPFDIVALDYSRAEGQGYFSDPYKYRDNRPAHRQQDVWMARWNHHFADLDGTARLSYRFYEDSWDIRAHTAGIEYVQQLPGGWTLTPSLRFHAQWAADFYLDARFPGLPVIVPRERLQSQDQRLSTFGAVTAGLEVGKQFGEHWHVDLEYERYEQRPEWYPFGSASDTVDTFRANTLQFGVTYSFD